MLEGFALSLALAITTPVDVPTADTGTYADSCSSISDNDMRYFCQGSCSSISKNDMR